MGPWYESIIIMDIPTTLIILCIAKNLLFSHMQGRPGYEANIHRHDVDLIPMHAIAKALVHDILYNAMGNV